MAGEKKFQVGQLVFLHAKSKDFRDEAIPPNEIAIILEDYGDGMYFVEVPKHLRFDQTGEPDPHDDGYREVDGEQMYPMPSCGDVLHIDRKEAKEMLYWHSETPDAGDPEWQLREELSQKLRKYVDSE